MKAIVVTDQAAGTAGMKLVEKQLFIAASPAVVYEEARMATTWVRALVALIAFVVVLVVGINLAGAIDLTPDPNTGVPVGFNSVTTILAAALIVALVAYLATEYAQTRRFDSIGTILVGVLAGPIAGAVTGGLANLIWTYVLPPPFQSPYAAPFFIVAVEIGLLAGIFGRLGFFRSRPNSPTGSLAVGAAVVAVVVAIIGVYGFLPFYTNSDTNVVELLFFAPAAPGAPGPDLVFVVLGWIVALLLIGAVLGLIALLAIRRDLGAAYVFVAGLLCGIVSAIISAPISAIVFSGVTGSGTDLLVAAFQKAGDELGTAVLKQGLLSDPIDKTVTYFVVFAILGALSRRFVARFPQGESAIGLAEA